MSKYQFAVVYTTFHLNPFDKIPTRYARITHTYDTPEKAVSQFEESNNKLVNKNKMVCVLAIDVEAEEIVKDISNEAK